MKETEIYTPDHTHSSSAHSHRAWLEVDLGAIINNARTLRGLAGAPLIPMVKADGYGLGAKAIVRQLESLNPWGYGVATVKEGEQLRSYGIERNIIVFTPLLFSEYGAAYKAGLIPTLGRPDEILKWVEVSESAPYHLSIDTGMNRAGASWRSLGGLKEVIAEHPPTGAFTHFHSAELYDGSAEIEEQSFREALAELNANISFLHVANSAAIVRYEQSPWNAIRPGVFMYGVGSGADAKAQPEPVVNLRTRVVDIRWVEPGDTISYDATYTVKSRQRIATVAAGYGDGYPRSLSNVGVALLGGKRIPIRGIVTMDMVMFDVTDVDCEIGDIVTLIGRDGDDLLTVEEVGQMAGKSPYELLTGLSIRLERVYSV